MKFASVVLLQSARILSETVKNFKGKQSLFIEQKNALVLLEKGWLPGLPAPVLVLFYSTVHICTLSFMSSFLVMLFLFILNYT